MDEKKLTGYPSIDKPWLKYYSEEAINAPMPSGNVYDYVWEHNKEDLDDIALVYFQKRITYGELFKNIDKATAAFQTIGVKSGDVISIISITTPEFVYCVYALNRIGAIVNMLDPRSSEHTLISQIRKTDSRILVILDQCANILDSLEQHLNLELIILLQVKESMGFPIKQIFSLKTALSKNVNSSINCKCVNWKNFLASAIQETVPSSTDKADLPAFIWYTGGTTGEPKGVLLSNRNVNSVAEQYRVVAKDHARQQTWLTVSAPFIAYSLICGLHLPLAYGMTCCIELYDPESMAKTIVREKYNHAAVTPIVWENILKNPRFKEKDFSFLVAPASGADYMSPKLEQELVDFFETHNCSWKICQGYGMTEVASGVAICSSNACYKPGSVGIPFPNTVISTFDVDSCRELPIGEVGEICIQGPSVMLEYYKNPEATKATVRQHSDGMNWMHTGDLGKIDCDGNLFITGRIKRMITRYDGFKVFPSVVEEKILMHPDIENCSVVGRKDPRSEGGQLPVAFIVLKKNKGTTKDRIVQEIQTSCINTLPEYARPVQFYIIEQLPLTNVGKVDYRTLEREAQKEMEG